MSVEILADDQRRSKTSRTAEGYRLLHDRFFDRSRTLDGSLPTEEIAALARAELGLSA